MALRPTSDRDVYANLLRDTRGLRRDQASARELWFVALPWEHKEDTLFELEMLLKGLVCFGNPRNHPGPPRRTAQLAHDFQSETRVLRSGMERAVVLVRLLLGQKDRAFTFARYLETVLPEDGARTQLVKDQLAQDTPEESLFLLRNAFASYLDLADGLARSGRVPHRVHQALHATITREIGRNAYFNPLVALEFRPELDRIRAPEVLEALHGIESEAAHRVTALTFLTLFRALRYLAIVDAYASEEGGVRRAYVLLAVMRSDLRALVRFLSRRAADVIADGLEHELLALPAAEASRHHEALSTRARHLRVLRAALQMVASLLRVEVRKCFERDLPAPDADVADGELAAQVVVVTAELRATLQHAVRMLCAETRPDAKLPELVADAQARRAATERLRRDVWMFTQILRAFLAKADAVQGTSDQWAGVGSFQFVREFLVHFRAIGYQLVRLCDYGRLDPFLRSLEELRDVDLLDPARLSDAVRECRALMEFLDGLFKQVSQRAEIARSPFDKRDAAETLKIYLGAA